MGNAFYRYLFVQSDKKETTLSFLPGQSHLVAFCINNCTHPRFRDRVVDNSVVNDAHMIVSSLENVKLLPEGRSRIFTASANTEKCTREGIEDAFKKEAKQVGAEGAFFFHFSGHGTCLQNGQAALVPTDYQCNEQSCITAGMLSKWLKDVKCKAKYVIFTIDCCYSGAIAEALFSSDGVEHPKLHVMAACMSKEVSFPTKSFGCSIFSYFLSYAINTTATTNFPIKDIHVKCQKLTRALSSFLIDYGNETDGPQQNYITHPVYKTYRLTLASSAVAHPKPLPVPIHLHQMSKDWLKKCSEKDIKTPEQGGDPEKCISGGLLDLGEAGVLEKYQVLDTVVAYLLQGVAIIQLHWCPLSVATLEIFEAAYKLVKENILRIQPKAIFGDKDKHWGLVCYMELLPADLSLCNLRRLKKTLESSMDNKGAEGPDSGTENPKVCYKKK